MTDAYSIHFRPDLGILVVRCQQPGGPPELREVCLRSLETARQHRAARWLLDVRRRDPLCPHQTTWLTEILYPLATRWLGPEPLTLAILSLPPARAAPVSGPAWLRVFAEEGAACQWLRYRQIADAVLPDPAGP
ncbi:hypothetical protein [Hymenobacter sp. 102]|uniref:hypothetical protein n=1 Tax=Hymenobacter sp. 102 TaxID=3403152 RepID=UPI003CF8D135